MEKAAEEQKKYEAELVQAKAMFEGLFEFAPDAILIVTSHNRIVQVNRQAESLFGYTREELFGRDHDILVPDRFMARHRENQKVYMSQPHIRHMGTGLELYGRKKDGSEFPVDIALGPMQMERDIVMLAVVRDFTERKREEETIRGLNADLLARNAELEFSNKELESFIYSVSHDLRAPLRQISGFAELMMKDVADKHDEKGKGYLSRINDGMHKMSSLIDALLKLSKISMQEIHRRKINLSNIAKAIVAELLEVNPGRRVEADIRLGLTAAADPGLIKIVLSNLLGNAWKFTMQTEKAHIEFGTVEQDGKVIYYVRDNGAGFDQKYAGKMFWPFQRLHSDEEFEGSGVGLAIVERIIRRHGGKVWAEGIAGKGATIYFSLA
jgi:PAS domain S-box-containing protein